MCNYYEQKKSKKALEMAFNAMLDNIFDLEIIPEYNGFAHPFTPVILNENPKIITHAQWGLLPSFAKNESEFRKRTPLLNARIETIEEKPSFKKSSHKRCLVLASAFFEWKHFDNGKLKVKHRISVPNDEPFAMAGIYETHSLDGVEINTFSIVTTAANELMEDIHNSKKRMPVILRKSEEQLWLQAEPFEIYHERKEVELIAQPLENLPLQLF